MKNQSFSKNWPRTRKQQVTRLCILGSHILALVRSNALAPHATQCLERVQNTICRKRIKKKISSLSKHHQDLPISLAPSKRRGEPGWDCQILTSCNHKPRAIAVARDQLHLGRVASLSPEAGINQSMTSVKGFEKVDGSLKTLHLLYHVLRAAYS